jgi:uncharacterized protein
MKLTESFVLQERREAVWEVVGDPERLLGCLPGVESVEMIDGENANVRLTQALGPFTVTFGAKAAVTGRDPGRSISFSATGRSVRGAAGNVRVTNDVRLEDEAEGTTRVVLEAEVALGGMLGTVGQKMVGRQAASAAKAFAASLEREVDGAGDGRAAPAPAEDAAPPLSVTTERFSEEFVELHGQARAWIEDYYDRDHLVRAADWLLALEPEAPEPLVLAALLHDAERSVPGGPVLDKAAEPWDDEAYNRAHCDRSAAVVAGWLVGKGASDRFVAGALAIREHEFGGSPEGDLLQAADSVSFLEVNGPLVARWVTEGECSAEKGREKLRWMAERVRLERARPLASAQLAVALEVVDRAAGGEAS